MEEALPAGAGHACLPDLNIVFSILIIYIFLYIKLTIDMQQSDLMGQLYQLR